MRHRLRKRTPPSGAQIPHAETKGNSGSCGRLWERLPIPSRPPPRPLRPLRSLRVRYRGPPGRRRGCRSIRPGLPGNGLTEAHSAPDGATSGQRLAAPAVGLQRVPRNVRGGFSTAPRPAINKPGVRRPGMPVDCGLLPIPACGPQAFRGHPPSILCRGTVRQSADCSLCLPVGGSGTPNRRPPCGRSQQPGQPVLLVALSCARVLLAVLRPS